MDPCLAYIPLDRRHALAAGASLPERSRGAALFADISGFTPLTEALLHAYGPRRGAEELTDRLNAVYSTLIHHVHRFGGSVIGFSGDAITCWFDDGIAASGERGVHLALAAGLAMQQAMASFQAISIPDRPPIPLAIKACVVEGPVQRFLVGDPAIQRLDVLAGSLMARLDVVQAQVRQGELLVDAATAQGLDAQVVLSPAPGRDETFYRVERLERLPVPPPARDPFPDVPPEESRRWVQPGVYERLRGKQNRFLAELRPAAALFLRFQGIDYAGDPRARDLLDGFVRWVQQVLAQYEGTLIQLTIGEKGSYLYAAFGAPIAHDDDPLRAVSAALQLRTPPPEGPVQAVQIGISWGRMRVGAYGSPTRSTYGVLGDAVNLAARLMALARPGQILVTPRVAQAVEERYHLRRLGPVNLKGRTASLEVHQVLGPRTYPLPIPATRLAPLVGREPELARVEELLAAVRQGQGRVLRIEGPGGIGKSHLAVTALVRAQELGFQVAASRCQSTGRYIAYSSVRPVVWQLLGLESLASAQEVDRLVEALQERVRAVNPDWLVRLPLLGDLLGVAIPDNPVTAGFDPQLRQEALTALAIGLVQDRARQQPLALLLDDVHWIDEASWRLLQALSRVIHRNPVLLVLTQRPGHDPSVAQRLDPLPHQDLWELGELDPGGMEALVCAALQRLAGEPVEGPVDPLLLDLIQTQAQGNPLFVEELLHALWEARMVQHSPGGCGLTAEAVEQLREANCLQETPEGWRLRPDAPLAAVSLGLPDSIHGIVLARLDRLPESVIPTLKVASVIGRTFELPVLQRAHPMQPELEELRRQMALLEQRDFTHLERLHPVPVYLFKHNITQEVIYRTLLASQQQEIHLAVAQALEALHVDAVEELAFHYHRAPLDDPPVRDKAVHYLVLAADRARREYANETALNYYTWALALRPHWAWQAARAELFHILGRREEEREALEALTAMDGAPPAQVALLWGRYHEATADYVQAREAIQRAQQLSRAEGDRRGEAQALARLGLLEWRQGDYQTAADLYTQALASLPRDEETQPIQAEIHYGLGILYRQLGRYPEAEAELQRALELNRALGNRQEEARTLAALAGLVHVQRRDFRLAMAYNQEALAIRKQIGDRRGQGASLLSLAQDVIRWTGDYGHAADLLQEALAIQQDLGDRWWESLVWNELGVLYLMAGHWEAAEHSLAQALAISQELEDEAGIAYVLGNLGQLYREYGQMERAAQALEQARSLGEAMGDRLFQAGCSMELAIVALEADDPSRAVEQARAALETLEALDMRAHTSAVHATLARAWLALGRSEQARSHAEQACQVLESGGLDAADYPQRDYLWCAWVFQALGETARAESCLAQAQAILEARAARIQDPALRRSFLEQVSFNRQIRRGRAVPTDSGQPAHGEGKA